MANIHKCVSCKRREKCEEKERFTALGLAIQALSDATWKSKDKEGSLHCYCSIRVECDYFDWDSIADGWQEVAEGNKC